jgi:hypothetical protein
MLFTECIESDIACVCSWSSSEDISASESGVERRAVPKFFFSSTAEVPEVCVLGMTAFWPGGCAIEAAEAIPAYKSLLDSVSQGWVKFANKKAYS